MTLPDHLFHYRARLLKVVDGDTIDVMLDLGFQTHCIQRLRLLRVNTPERGQPGHQEATALTSSLLQEAEIVIHTVRRDSFGRWLAEVWADGVSANDALVGRGWAA
jgi:micrococcal nuclease